MKYIYLLITFFFLSNSYGQDPQLFENSWYLQKIVLENGNEEIPIPNTDVPFISLIFTDGIPSYFETVVCNSFTAELTYDSSISFTIIHAETTLLLCDPEINYSFEGIQFGFFTTASQNHIEDPFPYTITTTGNEKTLVIINNRGDEAIYGNQLLSTETLTNTPFSIYPNPVINKLTIQKSDALHSDATIKVLDISGKTVLSASMAAVEMPHTLEVGNLRNGMYFLEIKSGDGLVQVIKFVKK